MKLLQWTFLLHFLKKIFGSLNFWYVLFRQFQTWNSDFHVYPGQMEKYSEFSGLKYPYFDSLTNLLSHVNLTHFQGEFWILKPNQRSDWIFEISDPKKLYFGSILGIQIETRKLAAHLSPLIRCAEWRFFFFSFFSSVKNGAFGNGHIQNEKWDWTIQNELVSENCIREWEKKNK